VLTVGAIALLNWGIEYANPNFACELQRD